MNRCYGNPVPRRNAHDNSTDMNSFPFVRHHFLRAGFEVIDCPPLTAQLKNSSDIRMVMDVRDYLTHDTYFDEFIILSGDADFTPVLHRLRAHARRTVIFANDFTAAPYTAISDGEVREADLIALILNGELPDEDGGDSAGAHAARPGSRRRGARSWPRWWPACAPRAAPVPLEALADRALRALGHEKTIATGWAGAGSFRELLRQQLPEEIKLTDEPPYLAFDPKRHGERRASATALEAREPPAELAGACRPSRSPPAPRRCSRRPDSSRADARQPRAGAAPAAARRPAAARPRCRAGAARRQAIAPRQLGSRPRRPAQPRRSPPPAAQQRAEASAPSSSRSRASRRPARRRRWRRPSIACCSRSWPRRSPTTT